MPVATNALLNSLRVGYSDVFEKAKAAAPSQWAMLATLVASTAASTTYGWLGQFPKLAEWTGQRAYKSMKEFGYSVTNKKYEASVKIPRTAFEDDTLDVYAPLFREMGYAAATHPDEIVFGLLAAGRTEDCYDGKKFFAADHPVYPNVDGTGSVVNTSNLLRPAAVESVVTDKTAWYLLDVSRPLKPFIFQERTKPEIINPSRKRRIAAGCGMQVEDVNRLLSQFKQMQKMVKQFGGGKGGPKMSKKMRRMMSQNPEMAQRMMGKNGGSNPFGF